MPSFFNSGSSSATVDLSFAAERSFHGNIAPPISDCDRSITRSTSKRSCNPSPWQSLQAPCGPLELNSRGLTSENTTLQLTQACRVLYRNVSQRDVSLFNVESDSMASGVTNRTTTLPCPNSDAVSIALSNLSRTLSRTIIRSTTVAKSYCCFGSIGGASSISKIASSIAIRNSPSRRVISIAFSRCIPSSTNGANTIIRVASGNSSIASQISISVACSIASPH